MTFHPDRIAHDACQLDAAQVLKDLTDTGDIASATLASIEADALADQQAEDDAWVEIWDEIWD